MKHELISDLRLIESMIPTACNIIDEAAEKENFNWFILATVDARKFKLWLKSIIEAKERKVTPSTSNEER